MTINPPTKPGSWKKRKVPNRTKLKIDRPNDTPITTHEKIKSFFFSSNKDVFLFFILTAETIISMPKTKSDIIGPKARARNKMGNPMTKGVEDPERRKGTTIMLFPKNAKLHKIPPIRGTA